MIRVICALVLVLLISTPSLGQQPLVGTYKMVSHFLDVGGTSNESMGQAPHGYLTFTPTRVPAVYTADDRKFGTSVPEKAGLFDTLTAWSGRYRIEGSKLVISPDVSWTENWNGTEKIRYWQLLGNLLRWTSDVEVHPRDPTKTAIVRQVWEKIE